MGLSYAWDHTSMVQVLEESQQKWGPLETLLNITADNDVLLESFEKFTATTRSRRPCDDEQALESPEGTSERGGQGACMSKLGEPGKTNVQRAAPITKIDAVWLTRRCMA
jgi:hypothetical protein